MKKACGLYNTKLRKCVLLSVVLALLFAFPSVRVFFVMTLASLPVGFQQKIGSLGLYSDPAVIKYAVRRLSRNDNRRGVWNVCQHTSNTNCLVRVLMDEFPVGLGSKESYADAFAYYKIYESTRDVRYLKVLYDAALDREQVARSYAAWCYVYEMLKQVNSKMIIRWERQIDEGTPVAFGDLSDELSNGKH